MTQLETQPRIVEEHIKYTVKKASPGASGPTDGRRKKVSKSSQYNNLTVA